MICEYSRFRLACLRIFNAVTMSSNTQRTSKDKPRSLKCWHFCLPFDNHSYCPSCREANKGDDPCVTLESLCYIYSGFSNAKKLKTPTETVPPAPGMALQQKIESKLERSLGSQFNIQLQQQMGVFQASMLEAMKSLQD